MLALAGTVMLYSCGGDKKEATTTTPEATTPEAPTSMVETPASPIVTTETTVTVNLEGDDQMKYNVNEIKAKKGQTVTINLHNVGKMPKDAMAHNFILLKPGTDVAAFAQKAIEAKATDYFPESEKANVIIHTKMLGPGETDAVTFPAPEPGTYEFICSFPGHYGIMRGKLIVE